jgi:hypothetical protein
MSESIEKNYSIEYWRDRYAELCIAVGSHSRADLVEFDEFFATAKGKDAHYNVTKEKAGLTNTRAVVLALEKLEEKKAAASNIEKSIIKNQKLVLR